MRKWMLVFAIALSVGCDGALKGGTFGGLFEKPQQPLPAPTTVQFSLSLDVPDALVVLARDDDQPATTVQTAPGRYAITTRGGPMGATLTVTAPSYTPYQHRLEYIQPDGFCKENAVPAGGDYELCDVVLHPSRVDMVPLASCVTASGPRWCLAGRPAFQFETSDFALLALSAEDLETRLTERAEHGPQLLRVFTVADVDFAGGSCGPAPPPGTHGPCWLHIIPSEIPNFYQHVRDVVQAAARHGERLELVTFTGARRLLPTLAQQQAHLDAISQIVRDEPSTVEEAGNEYEQGDNQWFFDQLAYPADLIAQGRLAAGSGGGGVWVSAEGLPTLGYGTYHTNGLSEWQRKGGHEAWEMAGELHVPISTNEQPRDDQDGDVGRWVGSMKACKLLAAACDYHTDTGRMSRPWTDAERALADAIRAALATIPDDCPNAGGYSRPDPPQDGPVLRIYQVGNDPACHAEVPK